MILLQMTFGIHMKWYQWVEGKSLEESFRYLGNLGLPEYRAQTRYTSQMMDTGNSAHLLVPTMLKLSCRHWDLGTLPNIGDNEEIDSDLTNANGISTTDKFTVLSGQMRCDLGAGDYPQAIIVI
ncbi:MAG: hypothetical protein IPP49_12080 [Saprospiraceae bacterium]|nr:hypothetical protein [Saprospiraceae bacterium]